MPCTMYQNWMPQKARKHSSWTGLMPKPASLAPPISPPNITPSRV